MFWENGLGLASIWYFVFDGGVYTLRGGTGSAGLIKHDHDGCVAGVRPARQEACEYADNDTQADKLSPAKQATKYREILTPN